MCGIAGSLRLGNADAPGMLGDMLLTLKHRGPDDEGTFRLSDQGIAFGMTRLSIIDIAGGHQPMFDEAGRFALVFNGEIYNFRDLWTELADLGHTFSTDHSDTEVIVHGFEAWGDGVFSRLNGMFAIAIWDRVERSLTLARDRMGEKPLYLGELRGGGWVFGSELKALLLHPDLDRAIDPSALEQFLAFDFVMGPNTMLKAVSKVPAGHLAQIRDGRVSVRSYWLPHFSVVSRTSEEMVEELDVLLRESVAMRMVADVPVGLFLSGGLDSTTIGYYMAQASSGVHAFSIGFEDPAFDESAEARLAAASLGVQHDVHVFSQAEVLDLVPLVTGILDEPMGDQSVFPTYLLSAATRRHVKVAIGGDGSDELFMGYKTYQALKAAWVIETSPLGPLARWVGNSIPELGPRNLRRLARFGRTLSRAPDERLMARLGSFHGRSRWVLSAPIRENLAEAVFAGPRRELDRVLPVDLGPADRTIGTYLRGYLQEDILVKVDRASMAASLEVRSPFLDPRIVDFALSLPDGVKLRGMRRKDPLRRLMRGRIPDLIIDRPKRGFGVPLSAWLRGSLAQMVADYLSPDRIRTGGFFDPSAVAAILARHAAGRDEAGNQVWLLLQFELWRERWLGGARAVAAA